MFLKNCQCVESIREYVVYLDKIVIEIFHMFMLYSPTHKITSLILTLLHIHQKMKIQLENEILCYIERVHEN
jgi:hypothetical protein